MGLVAAPPVRCPVLTPTKPRAKALQEFGAAAVQLADKWWSPETQCHSVGKDTIVRAFAGCALAEMAKSDPTRKWATELKRALGGCTP